jgi:hypothetical protein
MRTSVRLTIGFFLAFALTGCSSIRVVQEGRTGGTVALEGAHDSARGKAEEYMRSHCPGGWQIVEEGDAFTAAGVEREWRITYACSGSQGRTHLVAF